MIVARSSASICRLSLLPSLIVLCMSGIVAADEPKWESLIPAIKPESHSVVGKSSSRPHQNSGEGADGGIVTPDIALKNVKASDYDAILFSGGWGSSMYQYAFEGRYNNSSYNGDRATKTEVNRVINEFIQQDKYVCALCNAVSVLAWARVDGKSPLAGKRVCAPTRQTAAGIYNGRSAQPSCRWHPEQNGAIMSPAGAIGQPNSSHDDVLVDGRIITGEDDPSAREMGRRIVEVLSKQ
jgi:putative intracellular protease/amidase